GPVGRGVPTPSGHTVHRPCAIIALWCAILTRRRRREMDGDALGLLAVLVGCGTVVVLWIVAGIVAHNKNRCVWGWVLGVILFLPILLILLALRERPARRVPSFAHPPAPPMDAGAEAHGRDLLSTLVER